MTMLTRWGFLATTLCVIAHLVCAEEHQISFANLPVGPPMVRHKRSLPSSTYSSSEKQQIVDEHNKHRKAEPASDMKYMRWNEDIAKMAQDWANGCRRLTHGNPSFASGFTNVGQNIYISSSSNVGLTNPITAWHNEIHDYTYSSNVCAPNKACGHYTQIVWANTGYVGCGKNLCSDYTLVVCNYGEGGNVVGSKPYKTGDPCSQCDNGKFWCMDGLCDDCKGQRGCSCKATCANCANMDLTDCKCDCADGWRGNKCEDICENTDSRCGIYPGGPPGWPSSWCNTGQNDVDENCFLMCGSCTDDPHRTPCGPETAPDPCASTTCNNGGTKVPDGNSCDCTCAEGWTGNDCSTSTTDPCGSTNCANGGTPEASGSSCSCRCTDNYEGDTCSDAKDPCSSTTCNNGGTKQPSGNSCSCRCTDAYTGGDCSTPVDPCSSTTCNNGGTKQPSGNSCSCRCTSAYTGNDCSTPVDPCSSTTCNNGGTKQPSGNSCSCRCTSAYTGNDCSTPVDPCSSTTCNNGGTKQPSGNSCSCRCTSAYTGGDCSTPVDPCSSTTCNNGGTKQPSGNSCSCRCTSDYTGSDCSVRTDPCQSTTCLNQGTPTASGGSCECSCTSEYEGDDCSVRKDPCRDTTCRNGGTKTASGTSCSCQCASGFTGADCSERAGCPTIDCVNGVVNNQCQCECNDGYQGDDCSENVEHHRFGIKLRIRMSLSKWNLLWRILRPYITRAIQRVCNTQRYYNACCSGSQVSRISFPNNLVYIVDEDIYVSENFPKQRGARLVVLIYAQAKPDNELCAAGLPGRKKRQTTPNYLPQDVLLQAVEDNKAEIDQALMDCCNVVLDEVEKGEVRENASIQVASVLVLAICLAVNFIY